MALETTANYSTPRPSNEVLRDLPPSPDDHDGWRCMVTGCVVRPVKSKATGAVRRILTLAFTAIRDVPDSGIVAGATHDEEYWIDNDEGAADSRARGFVAAAVRACADGNRPLDWDIAETIEAATLGRAVLVRLARGKTKLYVAGTTAPSDRVKAQAVCAERPDYAELDARWRTLTAAVDAYAKTGRWNAGSAAAPAPGSEFIDDAIPF
jgi:hypothetical protein